ncbi:LpxD N-terminal domain-containing protein, partial [Psychrobacter sp. 1U2]
MITIKQIISQIEQRQPVLNKAELTTDQLTLSVNGVGSLTDANSTQLSFLADPNYITSLAQSQAGVVL